LRTCTLFLPQSPINEITSRPLQRICFNNPGYFARPELCPKGTAGYLNYSLRLASQLMASFAPGKTFARSLSADTDESLSSRFAGLWDQLSRARRRLSRVSKHKGIGESDRNNIRTEFECGRPHFPEASTQWLVSKSNDSREIKPLVWHRMSFAFAY